MGEAATARAWEGAEEVGAGGMVWGMGGGGGQGEQGAGEVGAG